MQIIGEGGYITEGETVHLHSAVKEFSRFFVVEVWNHPVKEVY